MLFEVLEKKRGKKEMTYKKTLFNTQKEAREFASNSPYSTEIYKKEFLKRNKAQ